MVDERRRHADVRVLHHGAADPQLVRLYQGPQRHASLVDGAGLDVGHIHLEERVRHLTQRRRPPAVHGRPKPRGPGE
jgi:hypothetical protein